MRTPISTLDSIARDSRHALEASFDAVFRAHHERLVNALTYATGEREAAADAVQDAFVKAHLKWRRISEYDDPVGWVRRVAINKLKDEKRRDRRKRAAVDRMTSEPGRFDDDPGANVMPTLMQLPRQQRLCIALYYVDGLSVREIAAALEIAEGSVRSNLHDGRRTLRGVVDQRDGVHETGLTEHATGSPNQRAGGRREGTHG